MADRELGAVIVGTLCEKPFARDADEAKQMLDAVRRSHAEKRWIEIA